MKTILLVLVSAIVSYLVAMSVVPDAVNTQNNTNNGSASVEISDLQGLENQINVIAREVAPSVVSIVVARDVQTYRSDPFGFFFEQGEVMRQQVGGGTGVILTKEGKILTNKHVVFDPDATYIIITHDGYEIEAKILATDPITDIAILQADVGEVSLVPAKFARDASSIDIGDMVIAVGNALGEFDNSLTLGIISATGRSIRVGDFRSEAYLHGLIQTDAAINQGNSGGPLVNISGEVIGINTATTSIGTGVGFAIPYTQAQLDTNLQSIEKSGEIARAYLGIFSVTLDAGIAQEEGLITSSGAYIPDVPDSIVPGAPADKAGLRPGDVITGIDGVSLTTERQIQSILSSKLPGDKILLSVLRGTQKKDIEVELGSR